MTSQFALHLSKVDLRLVPAAVGAYAVGLWGVAASPIVLLAIAALAVLTGAACVIAAGKQRHAASIALLCAAVSMAACGTAWHVVKRDASPLRAAAQRGESAEFLAELKTDPHKIRQRARLGSERYIAEAAAISASGANLGRVLVIGEGSAWGALLPGHVVRIDARLSVPYGRGLTAAVARVEGAPRIVRPPPRHQRLAGVARNGLSEAAAAVSSQPAAGVVPALSIGDTSLMNSETVDVFYTSGLSHLAAVSGGNIAIVVGGVLLAARMLRVRPLPASLVGCVSLVGFVILARPEPSVLRAAVMAGLALAAFALGRPRAAVPALCVAVIGLTIFDPSLPSDVGFALSVAATLGLVTLTLPLVRFLKDKGFPRGVSEALAATVAAQLACAPIIAGLGEGFNVVSFVTNLLVAPAVAPVTVFGVLGAVIAPLWSNAAAGFAWCASWPARWIVAIAEVGADFDGAMRIPVPAGVLGGTAVCAVFAVAAVLLSVARWRPVVAAVAALGAVAVVPVITLRAASPIWPGRWNVVACDVGQGDAIALRVAKRAAVVIDAGPEAPSVDRCLRDLDVEVVPILIFSHLHADHIGGAEGVFRGRRVGAVLTPGVGQPDDARRNLKALAEREGIRVVVPEGKWTRSVGPVNIEVLGGRQSFHGTRSDPNNNSLVIRASLHGVIVLLTGDVEVEAQHALLESGENVSAHILKVPHHGSAYSHPEFLRTVRPQIALVSVGRDNRYGHPSSTVLGALRSVGAKICRTDRDGACSVAIADNKLTLQPARPP